MLSSLLVPTSPPPSDPPPSKPLSDRTTSIAVAPCVLSPGVPAGVNGDGGNGGGIKSCAEPVAPAVVDATPASTAQVVATALAFPTDLSLPYDVPTPLAPPSLAALPALPALLFLPAAAPRFAFFESVCAGPTVGSVAPCRGIGGGGGRNPELSPALDDGRARFLPRSLRWTVRLNRDLPIFRRYNQF